MEKQKAPTVALMLCGNLFEDFFDAIGVSFESFSKEFTGSWMFGYVEALRQSNIETVLFFTSLRVSETLRLVHEPSNTKVLILPATSLYRTFRNSPFWNLALLWGKFRKTGYYKIRESYFLIPPTLFINELKNEGCNLILCQDYENASFDICAFIGYLINLPVFSTFQGGDATKSAIERLIRRFSIKVCTGLISGTRTEATRIQESYNLSSEKIIQIFNPLNLPIESFNRGSELRKELGIPLEAKVVAFHGRIDIIQKGLDVLLDSWEKICCDQDVNKPYLLIVGSGKDSEKFSEIITNKKLDNLIWVNQFINDRDLIRSYLSIADVYAFPSRYEGFPVAPIEAMACGLPVVAADANGVCDIFEFGEESGGIVVQREDAEALATAIKRVINDKELSLKLGKKAYQRVKDCFTLQVVGKQLEEAFSYECGEAQ